ncbi:MAG: fumarylacetoacetate hydrolase family protein [Cellvibrionaceae bacterium]
MKAIRVNGKSVVPSKVVCIGRNYVGHITELGNEIPKEPVVFLKPNSAISDILQAFHQEPLHYEGELCFVYEQGRFSAVGFGLDLTKRGLQGALKAKGLPWERAKAFDGAAVLGDFVSIDETILLETEDSEKELVLELRVNGELIQRGGISLMMYKPKAILDALQQFITLEDGDVVMTGTPEGVGQINVGDVFEGRVVHAGGILTQVGWVAE